MHYSPEGIHKYLREIEQHRTLYKGNGYYDRKLGTPVGAIDLLVPRDRDGDFRPQVLPDPFIRDSEDRFNRLQALFLSSYSPNNINSIFKGFIH